MMFRTLMIHCTVFALLLFSNTLFSGSSRALWVTRWDYQSPEDIEKIMTNASALNFNIILFQVRGDASVYYQSKYEPWSEDLDSGWDPLRLAVDLAHANNLQLHAWINVYTGWMGSKPPQSASHLYFTHPDWFMVDEYGNNQKLNSHYTWLSPTHPEVKSYLLNICEELYTSYNIDGLHLDYIRYPAPSYSYDPASLSAFKERFSNTPGDDPHLWTTWRRDAIAGFLAELYKKIKADRPALVLSASVLGDYSKGLRVYLQDSHEWLARGIIDVIYPMIYTSDDTLFYNQLTNHRFNDHGRHIYPGIYVASARHLTSQFKIAASLGCQGTALFSYQLLFPEHNNDNAFTRIIRSVWAAAADQAPLPWKKYMSDKQGPVVKETYTLPRKIYAGEPFKLVAKITDESGVYDDKTGSDGQGIYLMYDRNWPPSDVVEVKMSVLRDTKNWYITDKPISPQKVGLDCRFRIFAWDNYHESAGHPKRNLGFSDIWSLSILTPQQTYVSKGPFGPEIWQASCIAMDAGNHLWIGSDERNQVTIFNESGEETSFSPIRTCLDEYYEEMALESIAGMAFLSPSTIFLASGAKKPLICRYDTDNGTPLRPIQLDFTPSEIACGDNGHLFVLEQNSTRFHVINQYGVELEGSPFGIDHTGNDIAVLENGSRVFISDRTSNGVQCWHGAIEGYRARYWREPDLPAVDVGVGKVKRDTADYVYVPHAQRGVVTIYNRVGKPVEHLIGGNPILNAPLDIAVSSSRDSLFVLEMSGEGPGRIALWIKEKN